MKLVDHAIGGVRIVGRDVLPNFFQIAIRCVRKPKVAHP